MARPVPVQSDKTQRISTEKARLSGVFKALPADAKRTAEKLIDNAAFMSVTLEDLAEYVNEHGCTEEYQNGANQSGKKKSSEVEVYNVMVKNYKAIMDTLLGLLPKVEVSDDDGFDDFVTARTG